MLPYKEFYNNLKDAKLISPIWGYELELIEAQIKGNANKDNYLNCFSIYFSLIDSGNVCMSLDEDTLKSKWEKQINDNELLFKDKYNEDNENLFNEIKDESSNLYQYLKDIPNLAVVGNRKIFIIDDASNNLFIKKYYNARNGIIDSMDRLFNTNSNNITQLDLDKCFKEGFSLSDEQRNIVIESLNKNLLITGGPGTGKTTVVFFVLLNILMSNPNANYKICLSAASGKAASRMKEQIKNNLNNLNDAFKADKSNQDIIGRIEGSLGDEKTEEFTIHRLLQIDLSTNKFKYNKNNQFPKESIFIIDEASMIDICLFNNLLNAIPTGAHVFILGDKNQLPSVEVGAVFQDLLEKYSNNKMEITKSMRFKDGTDIDILAKAINAGQKGELRKLIGENNTTPLVESDFKNPMDFEIKVIDQLTGPDGSKDKWIYPIHYYLNNGDEEKKKIEYILHKWTNAFYINNECETYNEKFEKSNLKLNNDIISRTFDLDSKDFINNKNAFISELKKIFEFSSVSKVISAENNGIRGVNIINYYIKSLIYKNVINGSHKIAKVIKEKSVSNNYVGQLMMISKNNKLLDLYNGDCGILVTFKDDNTLYLMVNKESKLSILEEYKKDDIFKMGKFVFYPFRLFSYNEIQLAYAITVHKSQGSDYENILVFIPTVKGHPLLNRQIIYTAITRTKGSTYILSSLEMLNAAKDNKIERDTDIK